MAGKRIQLALRSNLKAHSSFKGFILQDKSFEKMKGVGDQRTISWNALLDHYAKIVYAAFVMSKTSWEQSIHHLYPLKSLLLKSHLKWSVLSTLDWNMKVMIVFTLKYPCLERRIL